jgi:arylsulfatase A-like enzyme
VVSEVFFKGGDRDHEGRMVRTERFKYNCYNKGARPEQLFDLQRDPGEIFNLATSVEHRDMLREHRLMLQEWLKTAKDDFQPAVALS